MFLRKASEASELAEPLDYGSRRSPDLRCVNSPSCLLSCLLPLLLVEDNDDNVVLIRHALRKVGLTTPIQVATTGEEAVEYLEGRGRYSDWRSFPLPRLVLLDLKLPGMSGFDVLSWVRSRRGLKSLRVAMLTSSERQVEIDTAYELGANTFLTKPVQLEKLEEIMRALWAHWLQHSQSPTVSRFAMDTT